MKLRKRFAALCATALVFCSSILPANAANYNVHYHRYADNNVTLQTLSVGNATQSGKVTVRNNCTTFSYANYVKTTAAVYCVGPQGQRYYNIVSVNNTTTGNKAKTGNYTYINIGNTIKNTVELYYDSSLYNTQKAIGTTTSY